MSTRKLWLLVVGLCLAFALAGCVVYINGQPHIIEIQPQANGTPGVVVTLVPIQIAAAGGFSQTTPVFVPAVTVTPSAPETPVPTEEVVDVPPTQPPTSTWTVEPSPTSTATATAIAVTPVAKAAAPIQAVVATTSPVRTALAASIASSSIPNGYSDQTNRLAEVLVARLAEFNLPGLGITEASMAAALSAPGVGDRLIGLVVEVWSEWIFLSQQQGFDPQLTEARGDVHGLSPFRRLVINLIQGRQGVLVDYQQHGLYNYFVRAEPAQAWRDTMDAVIGAVNRESFQWP